MSSEQLINKNSKLKLRVKNKQYTKKQMGFVNVKRRLGEEKTV